jgi:gluconolactonase
MSSKTGWFALIPALVAAGTAAATTLTPINPRSAYPEGPVLSDGMVFYAEMGADRVLRWDGAVNTEIWSRRGCGPTSVARGGRGTLVVLCHREGALVRINPDGEELGVIGKADAGGRFDNPNASVNDGRGGIYFSSSGTFAPGAAPEGAVLYLDQGGGLARLAGDIHYANGVALSPGGATLFVSEHLSRRVLAFDVAADASLSNPRVFLSLDDVVGPGKTWEAGPDGLATDRQGNLYIAEYGGGRLIIVDPAAKLIATIGIPEQYVTAPLLIDDERRLLITAPASLFNPEEPGKVYVMDNPAYRGD